MALDMIEELKRFSAQRVYALGVRIGISTGAAAAGVIGKRKFRFDLWGDPIEIKGKRAMTTRFLNSRTISGASISAHGTS